MRILTSKASDSLEEAIEELAHKIHRARFYHESLELKTLSAIRVRLANALEGRNVSDCKACAQRMIEEHVCELPSEDKAA